MNDDNQALLESILAAQVLLLARDIAREKQGRGMTSTGNHYREAVRMLRREHRALLAALHAPG